jgi:hypothetical protein
MAIPPALTGAYNWRMDQSETKVIVTLTFPLTFNVCTVRAELIANHRGILVSASDLPPLLHGRLFGEASSLSLTRLGQTVTVELTKSIPGLWDIIVTAGLPGMDPKSAYLLWVMFSQSSDPILQERAAELLQASASACFVPAMRLFGQLLLGNPELQLRGLEMLRQAAFEYGDSISAAHIGYLWAINPGTESRGFRLLEETDCDEARLLLGKLYSPVSGEQCTRKDARAAIGYLEKVANRPAALAEMAHIYREGAEGVPKDVKKATELLNRAKEIAAEQGEGEEEQMDQKQEGRTAGWPIVLGSIIAIAFFGLALFLHVRRRT